MSESFENFLKEKGSLPTYNQFREYYKQEIQLILVKDLGEWAWSIFSERSAFLIWHLDKARREVEMHKIETAFEHFKEEAKYVYSSSAFYWVHFNLALACLGEKEVKKRLGLKE